MNAPDTDSSVFWVHLEKQMRARFLPAPAETLRSWGFPYRYFPGMVGRCWWKPAEPETHRDVCPATVAGVALQRQSRSGNPKPGEMYEYGAPRGC